MLKAIEKLAKEVDSVVISYNQSQQYFHIRAYKTYKTAEGYETLTVDRMYSENLSDRAIVNVLEMMSEEILREFLKVKCNT